MAAIGLNNGLETGTEGFAGGHDELLGKVIGGRHDAEIERVQAVVWSRPCLVHFAPHSIVEGVKVGEGGRPDLFGPKLMFLSIQF